MPRDMLLMGGGISEARDTMISRHTHRLRPQVLIIFLIALGLVCAGARVPDLSRPHRPKPSQRVVFENQIKSSPDSCRHCGDVLAIVAKLPKLDHPVILSSAASPFVAPLYSSPLLVSNSARSPPASRA